MLRIATLLSLSVVAACAADVSIAVPEGSSRIDFALARLEQSLQQRGDKLVRRPLSQAAQADIAVLHDSSQAAQIKAPSLYSPPPGPEAFRTVRLTLPAGRPLILAGGDERGAMYGILDLSEQLRLRGGLDKVPQRTVKPRFPFRAIKFNLPWMSYRKGEALQLHMETCRDLNFWRAFLDMMAENRFNTLTLWNLHPFGYMIRPRNFPDATALTDAQLRDWQKFWRGLFRMAKDRGIDTYLVNWNIFVSPDLAKSRGLAKYSTDWSYFGDGDRSEQAERYTRECVTQVLAEYEDLTGLGVTLGERMGGMTSEQRRDWIEQTFIAGIKAAKRPARFIYRAPLSAGTGSGGSTSEITERITRESIERSGLPEPVWVEFKYNWSHAYSASRLHIVHGGELRDNYWNPLPEKYRAVWTMRNEDFFVLRWAEPGFLRDVISNNGEDFVGGFLIGSECYIPAREYTHIDSPHRTWKYAFERQWLFYSLWGHLLFDPSITDEFFEMQLSERYGAARGRELLHAWRLASRTPLRIASFYRGTSDGTLYSEGFLSSGQNKKSPFIDVDSLINRPVLDPAYVSVAGFVKAGRKVSGGKISPLALADMLDRDCDEARRVVAAMRVEQDVSPTLECELLDIQAWANLGHYLAEKLRGAVALASFRAAGREEDRQQAVTALERASGYWVRLAETVHTHNKTEIPYVFDEKFSWNKFIPAARQDIETARSAITSSVPSSLSAPDRGSDPARPASP
jgi:hypothetical protein